jgi:tetratricopeptide (TPR) repeat protein
MRYFSILIVIFSFILFTSWLDPYEDEVIKGNTFMKQKKYDDALKAYNNAKKYVPNKKQDKRLSFNRGTAYYMLKEYKDSIYEFTKALQLEDRNLQKKAFYNLGNAYLKQENVQKAVQSYINALNIDPKYAAPNKNLEYLLKYK